MTGTRVLELHHSGACSRVLQCVVASQRRIAAGVALGLRLEQQRLAAQRRRQLRRAGRAAEAAADKQPIADGTSSPAADPSTLQQTEPAGALALTACAPAADEVALRPRCVDLLREQQLVTLLARHAMPGVAARCRQHALAALTSTCREALQLLDAACPAPRSPDAAPAVTPAGRPGVGVATTAARAQPAERSHSDDEQNVDGLSPALSSFSACLPALLVHCSTALAFAQVASCGEALEAAHVAAACCLRLRTECSAQVLARPSPVHFGTEASLHATAASHMSQPAARQPWVAMASTCGTPAADYRRSLAVAEETAAAGAAAPAAAPLRSRQTLSQVLVMAADVAHATQERLAMLPTQPTGGGSGGAAGGCDASENRPSTFPVPRPEPPRSREGVDFDDEDQLLKCDPD